MSTIAAPTTTKRPLVGTLFMKETVALQPKEDGTERSMCVLQVATENDVVRITDFTSQNENLVEGRTIRLVFEETNQMRDDRPVTYRNLVTAVQS